MGKTKFIEKIKKSFGFTSGEEESKKASIKELLAKLEDRKAELKAELKECKDDKKTIDIKDSLQIIKKQIKKGEKLL